MATFVELAARTRVRVDSPIDKITLFREAENDFIEKTLCTESYSEIETEDENGGTLTNLYSLPTGFVKEHRVEFDGIQLKPLPQGTGISIRDKSGTLRTGTPIYYWIENEDLQLIPAPNTHGTIGVWYTKYNTDDDSTSPIIPTIEHRKLINYVNAEVLTFLEEYDKANYFMALYQRDVDSAYLKYDNERFKQGTIVDVCNETAYPFSARSGGAGSINVLETYIWKKVPLGVVLTEQTLTTGSGELTLAKLDSGQTSLPTFGANSSVTIGSSYQDRDVNKTTEESVSGSGLVSVGLTLSPICDDPTATPYYDIIIRDIS